MKIRRVICAGLIVSALAVPCNQSAWTHHERNKDTAHAVAEMMRDRGYPEDHPIIIAAQEWWKSEHEASQSANESHTTEEQRKRYPVASLVWELCKEAGYSDVVTAGILGNFMAECGGHTLDLQPYLKVDGFYGLAMWSLYYTPEVDGRDVHGQIDILAQTIKPNMESYGYDFESFLALEDVRQAARWFSNGYERPAVWSEKRADNAEVAYRYFVGE